jgi:hypothetical protein
MKTLDWLPGAVSELVAPDSAVVKNFELVKLLFA